MPLEPPVISARVSAKLRVRLVWFWFIASRSLRVHHVWPRGADRRLSDRRKPSADRRWTVFDAVRARSTVATRRNKAAKRPAQPVHMGRPSMKDNKIATIARVMDDAKRRDLVHHSVADEALDGRTISINGRTLSNFGTCSYLNLEHHEALRAGAHAAIDRYGTQFSSSRAFASLPL
ncbi:MAG: hypothetical protein HC834_05825 [Rhodospirillales bacterium]|nr:hypothetical protein [Rhodospirillales bacterium]